MSESFLKYTVLTVKVSLEFLHFSLYILRNYLPLSRPHYTHHTKYMEKVDKTIIYVMIASEVGRRELI